MQTQPVKDSKLNNQMDKDILTNLRAVGETDGYGDVDDIVPEDEVHLPGEFAGIGARRLLSKASKLLGISEKERKRLQEELRKARTQTAGVARFSLDHVKSAEDAFVNATKMTDETKSAHASNNELATTTFGKKLRTGIDAEIQKVDSDIAEDEAWTVSYENKTNHTCAETRQHNYTQCKEDLSHHMKRTLIAMKIKANAEHIKYGDAAAREAEDLGHALKLKMSAGADVVTAHDMAEKRVAKSVDAEKQFVEPALVDPYYKLADTHVSSLARGSSGSPPTSTAATPSAADDGMPPTDLPEDSSSESPPAEETAPSSESSATTAAPPSAEVILLQDQDDCEIAKNHAYGECRTLTNEAYVACGTLYFNAQYGAPATTDANTGSDDSMPPTDLPEDSSSPPADDGMPPTDLPEDSSSESPTDLPEDSSSPPGDDGMPPTDLPEDSSSPPADEGSSESPPAVAGGSATTEGPD